MTLKFECKMCGNCCRNLRGRGEPWPGSLPDFVFVAVPHSQKTISLEEWEVSILSERARELSVEFRAQPDYMFWDEISKVPIVTQWALDHDNCPFLSRENICLVNEQKPLTCQAYPLMVIELFNDDDKSKRLAVADCPNAVELPFKDVPPSRIKPADFFRELFQRYHSAFLGNMRLASTAKLFRNAMLYLTDQGLVRPASTKKKGVLKALLREKPEGLLEYLRKRYSDIEQKLRKEIRLINDYTLTDLEKLIKELPR